MGEVKEEALKMIVSLPEETSWDEIMYQVYVRKKVQKGVEAAEKGHVISHEEVKKRFLSR